MRENETIIPKDKRFVTVKEYCERTGLSYETVRHMCDSGQVNFIETEGGHRRIDTREPGAVDGELLARVDKIQKMLDALCRQFNTAL